MLGRQVKGGEAFLDALGVDATFERFQVVLNDSRDKMHKTVGGRPEEEFKGVFGIDVFVFFYNTEEDLAREIFRILTKHGAKAGEPQVHKQQEQK
jgi:hypothetical protein